jgi:hypothetical protein
MRNLSTAIAFFVALFFTAPLHADAPATEFFAIETAKLAKFAPADSALDALSSNQLADISIAHGWYEGGLAMRFLTPTFRIDARFSGSAGDAPSSIAYNIAAGNDQTSWSLLSERGAATKQGKQFVTENWRKQRITVILRFLDLKQ